MENRIIRLDDVKRQTGLSRSSIYSFIKAGRFPRCIRLGPRAVGWLASDIDRWIAARVQNTDDSGR